MTSLWPEGFEPMLGGKFSESKLQVPVFMQPKFDGIRCMMNDGAYTRTMKPVKNDWIQNWAKTYADFLMGLDGEMMVGSPTASDVYRKTASGVMSQAGHPDFCYYVFDNWNYQAVFRERNEWLKAHEVRIGQQGDPGLSDHIHFVKAEEVFTVLDMYAQESDYLTAGYEGAILRGPNTLYKYGRATSIQGQLIKLKRFIDEEAEIIGFQELMSNENEAKEDAFGRTKRSSHGANKTPQGLLGAFIVRNARGQTYNVGMGQGLDMALRKRVWDDRDAYLSKWITVRYVAVGGYDVPRFPGFHGFRPIGT